MIGAASWIGRIATALVVASAMIGSASCSPGEAQHTNATARLEFTGYVVDQAGVLGAEARRRLTDRLGRFERQTSHQFAVVTVATLGGEDVGRFTKRLANDWKVGRKGVNDGIVLLVAPNDRKARISVGDGLQQNFPDSFCQRIMDREMVPAFAQGRFEEGVEAGVSAVMARLNDAQS